jgi:hypothetical protein
MRTKRKTPKATSAEKMKAVPEATPTASDPKYR